MSGFGKITFKGEYFNQTIINVFHYRSTNWLPVGGNPFDDVLAFVDAVRDNTAPTFVSCLPSDYTLRSIEGVGYDDQYNLVTSSPLIRTENLRGAITGGNTMGAANCAIVSLRCGPQHQINGNGQSKRNRGYLAVGPMIETGVDDYSHISVDQTARLEGVAMVASQPVTVLLPPCTLTPIRIHEKWTTVGPVKILDWRTYSDILGWRVNGVASYRRSRQPEA